MKGGLSLPPVIITLTITHVYTWVCMGMHAHMVAGVGMCGHGAQHGSDVGACGHMWRIGHHGAQWAICDPGVLNRAHGGVGESPYKCCIHAVMCVTLGTNDPCGTRAVESLPNCYKDLCPGGVVWTTYIYMRERAQWITLSPWSGMVRGAPLKGRPVLHGSPCIHASRAAPEGLPLELKCSL